MGALGPGSGQQRVVTPAFAWLPSRAVEGTEFMETRSPRDHAKAHSLVRAQTGLEGIRPAVTGPPTPRRPVRLGPRPPSQGPSSCLRNEIGHAVCPLLSPHPPRVFCASVACDCGKIVRRSTEPLGRGAVEKGDSPSVFQEETTAGGRPESSATFNPYEPETGPWTADRGERRWPHGWGGHRGRTAALPGTAALSRPSVTFRDFPSPHC